MSKNKYLSQAIDWATKRSVDEIKSVHEDYDDTKTFRNKNTDETIQPDVSFKVRGGIKHFSEVALKSENIRKLVTRWKFLSIKASLNRGKLFLLAPRGHKMFTERLVSKYNINAIIYSL